MEGRDGEGRDRPAQFLVAFAAYGLTFVKLRAGLDYFIWTKCRDSGDAKMHNGNG